MFWCPLQACLKEQKHLISSGLQAELWPFCDGEFIVNTFTIWTYNLADINILIHIVISIHSI